MKEEIYSIAGIVIAIGFFSGSLPDWFYDVAFAAFITLGAFGIYLDYKEHVDKVVRTDK